MSIKALERHLLPLMPFLKEDGVTEICINRPKEIFVERDKQFYHYNKPELDLNFLETLAALVAEFNQKEFPSPLVAGRLPSKERIQIVMNPACESEHFICAIRRPYLRRITLEEYKKVGAFNEASKPSHSYDKNKQLTEYLHDSDVLGFMKLAIESKKNILISGGTGTGKTTFLNACLDHIPANERLLTIEDAREVQVEHSNTAHLLFNEDDPKMSAQKIFQASLRLRPDRIFLSELRGSEVWPYLRAANSGHPGSLSTVHADTPDGAIMQLVFMMQQAGSTSSEERILRYISSIINIVVQLKRDTSSDRFMYVSDIYFDGLQKQMR